MSTILRIAVPSPLYRLFDYLPPAATNIRCLQPGSRLRIPFGRAQTVAILLEISDHSELPEAKLKTALALLDEEPLIPAELLKLLRWASDYYHHPIGEVMATALPTRLRQGEIAQAKHRSLWKITTEGSGTAAEKIEKRARRQADLLRRLQAQPEGITREQLVDLPGNWPTAMAALVKKGWVTLEQIPTLSTTPTAALSTPPSLNKHQQQARETINRHLGEFAPFLLDGVTGSGKTEVYLQVIQQVLNNNQQALVLVPEITLTPQLVSRFQKRFSVPIAQLHSGLNDGERLNSWLYARSGEAAIIIGTRSAIFAPLLRPGIIIVDEEHDSSFKQQSGFRYAARDLAVVRAKQLNIPVVLGSATPSCESLLNVEQGRYQRLSLPERAGNAQPPTIRCLDLRNQHMEAQLSQPLLKRIEQHLNKRGQVLLFLNRRGYAPTLICHECGWVAQCLRCDASMILHQHNRRLSCHHCGSQRPIHHQCMGCGSADLLPLGAGTERTEEALQHHFPDATVSRIDRDNTRRKGSMEAILEAIHSGDTQILIGTQMLAKGHHFPNVTLVAILDGDQGLFSIDFRAAEQMAQLITQVAGRAGRAERKGEVVIQTHHPDHPLLQLLCEQGYHAFACATLAERKITELPPFCYLALLRSEAGRPELAQEFLQHACDLAAQQGPTGIELHGPLPAPMERRAGKYRSQLLIQSAQRATLHRFLKGWVTELSALPLARKVRWSLDVDPVDLI